MKGIVKIAGLALAGMVLVLGVFAGCKKQQAGKLTIEEGVLSVGMEIGYPPMEYYDENGVETGFDVAMAKALAEKMGLQVKFVDTAWDGIFAGVDTGKYDCIMSSVTITEARLEAHNFTRPYVGNAMSLVLLKNSSIAARTPQELTGLGVAYQEETTADFFMANLAAQGLQFTPYEYDKVMYCFDELRLGRVDAIVTDSLVAVDYVAPADSPFEIVWQGEADEVFGICLKKGNDALTAELDTALNALFAEGTMLRISREIFGGVDMVSAARN
jgi:polar amino acid transport system substrate-binding protein